MAQSWPVTLHAAQSWHVTLVEFIYAEGYGNTTSEGYGSATAAQSWPIEVLDGSAAGYGNTTSAGFDDGAVAGAGEVVWYDIDVTVLVEGATRPFLAPLDVGAAFAPLDVAHVLAPLDVVAVYAPLDVNPVFAPLDMETEV